MIRLMLIMSLALTLAGCATADNPPLEMKRIAITFDDIPGASGAFLTPDERAGRLISALERAGVEQAGIFVTPGNLAKPDGKNGEQRIERYVTAGHVIANHSFAHRRLSGTTAEEFIADIDRAEEWLKGRSGYRPWFRFPYLDEGRQDKEKRDKVRQALHARGLRNGYVTVDGADWNLEALTKRAVSDGRPIDRNALRDLYVETMVAAAEFNEDLALRVLGRSPAHVLLLHETDLAALFIEDLVAGLRKEGWTIITVDEAYDDDLGTHEPDVPSAQGTLTEAIAWEKGFPAPRWYDRTSPRVADPLFKQRVLAPAD